MKNKSQRQLCIVCTCGGHLFEAVSAIQDYTGPKFFMTDFSIRLEPFVQNEKVYFVEDHNFKLHLLMKNIIKSFLILFKENPDIVLSTGASLAIPTCLLAKLFRKKLIYVETGGNVFTPTRTGRLIYRIADVFLIQWKPLKRHFPESIHGGPLL